MNERQSMNQGVPDCSHCDGKGMCDKHKVEFLEHEAITALTALRDELLKQANERTKNRKEPE